jgi:membrane protein DedA with SNARE-associated domain
MGDIFLSKLLEIFVDWGYFGVYLASLGLFPAEIVIALFAASDDSNILLICIVACLGALTGAYPAYALGYILKEDLLYSWLNGKGKFLHIDVKTIQKTKEKLAKKGWVYVLITRMIPWLRVVTSVAAGFINVNIFQFTLGVIVGTFIYTLFIAYVGFEVGHNWELTIKYINSIDKTVIAILLAYILLSVTYKSRRKVVKRLKASL